MFIVRDRFPFCSIRKIENGREDSGYKHFVLNGTFSDSLLKKAGLNNRDPFPAVNAWAREKN